MGSDAPTAADDERPLRTVTVRSFKLARVELTSEQYAVFARAVGRAAPELDGKQPAINISWNDAQAFIAWLNATSGMKFRLPSEAEWEYAARAGSATDYWWGDAYSADYANGTGTAGRDIWMESAPVGQSPANAFGLHDMNGNVWEWTADCYVQDYAGASSDGSPATGAADCGRVLRGGSWCDTPAWMRSATRNWFDAEERFDYVGVRLAHD
jgi:formylglycine-generating enzyme required for sulfatase activity